MLVSISLIIWSMRAYSELTIRIHQFSNFSWKVWACLVFNRIPLTDKVYEAIVVNMFRSDLLGEIKIMFRSFRNVLVKASHLKNSYFDMGSAELEAVVDAGDISISTKACQRRWKLSVAEYCQARGIEYLYHTEEVIVGLRLGF
jgi:hypothetical protein